MKKLLISISLMLGIWSLAGAATYYISPTGNDTTGDGSTGTPWATLAKAFSEMSGGDTIILKNGTYGGTSNAIAWNVQVPVAGTAENWTVIKAENDGEAILDGEGVAYIFRMYYENVVPIYTRFEGLTVKNGGIEFEGVSQAKLLRCFSYDSGDGNTANFVLGRRCEYMLVENCAAWGSGRTKFSMYQSSNCIIRQCVGRLDHHDGWSGSHGEPFYTFGMYSTRDCELQNVIAIDCDQSQAYTNHSYLSGGISIPSTDMDAHDNRVVNSIVLRSSITAVNTTGNEYHAAYNSTFENCVFWDCHGDQNMIRGCTDTFRNCTFGVIRSTVTNYWVLNSYDGIGYDNNTKFRNSILYDLGTTAAMNDVEDEDYNSYFSNTATNFNAMSSSPNSNDIVDVNPLTASLLYLPRIESGSSLSGAGEGGVDIGANLTNLIGVSGTLWGETGYNVETSTPMWPFPNEDLIKSKMNAYRHTDSTGTVSGNRGFASTDTVQLDGISPVTLTSYIWEYLGNPIPPEIYGEVSSTVTVTASVSSTSSVKGVELIFASTATTTSGNIVSYLWNFGDGTTSTLRNPVHTYSVADTYNVLETVTDSNGNVGTASIEVLIESNPLLPLRRDIRGSFNIFGASILY